MLAIQVYCYYQNKKSFDFDFCFTTNFEEVRAAGEHAKFVMLVNAVQIEESDEL